MSENPSGQEPLRFGIVCPAWNCAQWVERSLESIQRQTYRHFRCVLIDDVSSDTTFETAKRKVEGDERFVILRNETRQYPLGNIVKASRLAADRPEDVLIIVDADDWLKHDRVFERMAQIYADPEVWLTYGSNEFLNMRWRDRIRGRSARGQAAPYPPYVAANNLFRFMPGSYLAVHLRTYRKFLWDALKDEDLRDERGNYWRACADPATMWPMMEMATEKHIRYVHDILYVYNNNHSLSERRPNEGWFESDQFLTNVKLRAKSPYQPLKRAT